MEKGYFIKRVFLISMALVLIQSYMVFADNGVEIKSYFTTEAGKNPLFVEETETIKATLFKDVNFKDLKTGESYANIDGKAGSFALELDGVKIIINSYITDFGQKIDFEASKNGEAVKIYRVYVKSDKDNLFLYKYDKGISFDKGLSGSRVYDNKSFSNISSLAFELQPKEIDNTLDSSLLQGESLEEYFNSEEEIIQAFEVVSPLKKHKN